MFNYYTLKHRRKENKTERAKYENDKPSLWTILTDSVSYNIMFMYVVILFTTNKVPLQKG